MLKYLKWNPFSVIANNYLFQVHSNGSSLEMKSTDNQIITVLLQEPLSEPLEGWIEVRGNGQGRSNVICQHLLPLNDIIGDGFGEFVKETSKVEFNSIF